MDDKQRIDRIQNGTDNANAIPNPTDTAIPTSKRTRKQNKSTRTRDKTLLGTKNGMEGFMKMPVEIFAQIASFLNPGDLVALARSNKTLRNTLLQRSAIQMWRQAESNVLGLPCCPVGLNEPQYAALIFSKVCTLCGGSAFGKPDAGLHVRLCATCRETQLVEIKEDHEVDLRLLHRAIHFKPKKDKSKSRAQKNSIYCLRQSVQDMIEKQQDLRHAEDKQALISWEGDSMMKVLARQAHASHVQLYFRDADLQRLQEVADLKQEREDSIIKRLKALGWTDEDMELSGPERDVWHALIRVPKPLTERIWDSLLPKLIQILDENRRQKAAKEIRRSDRQKCVDEYLLDVKSNPRIFEPILKALGLGQPPFPLPKGMDDVTRMKFAKVILARERIQWAFPKTKTVLSWNCLRSLKGADITGPEMEAELEKRNHAIEEKVVEWQEATEQQLIEIFQSGGPVPEGDIALAFSGSTQPATDLSWSTRLLLRADTVFKPASGYHSTDMLYNYPRFISPTNNALDFHACLYRATDGELDLSKFIRDVETERVIKQLLNSLGMPDISYLELQLMGGIFVCGRCENPFPNEWDKIVAHYIEKLRKWGDKISVTYHFHHPIVLHNVHDPELAHIRKPLVRLLSKADDNSLGSFAVARIRSGLLKQVYCYLCVKSGLRSTRIVEEKLLDHMHEVHEVSTVVKGVHYGTSSTVHWSWPALWGAHHYAHTK